MLGSCLCGLVQYRVKEFDVHIANCHCTMCRKSSGSAFATYGSVSPENFSWLQGEQHVKIYRSSALASRGFCNHCGSNLFYKLNDTNSKYEISLGTLDEEPNAKPNANIFCKSKAEWSSNYQHIEEFNEGRQ